MVFGLTEVTVGTVAVTTVTVAVAVTDVSATDVAVRMTVLGEGTVAGAVYTPVVEPIVPIPVSVVERDHVTFSHVEFEVILHPGLLAVAANRNVSPVPTVALFGVMMMLIPVMIVMEHPLASAPACVAAPIAHLISSEMVHLIEAL